jgi:RNA polymerase sigma factor (sigma-70 family)
LLHSNAAPMSDAALVKSCLDGHKQSWDTLVARYTLSVYRLARGYHLSREDAAEVVQDTFENVFRGLARKKEDGNLGGWIRTIARNATFDLMRKRGKVVPEPLNEDMVADYGNLRHAFYMSVLRSLKIVMSEKEDKLWRVMLEHDILSDCVALARLTGQTDSQVRHIHSEIIKKLKAHFAEKLVRQN